MQPLKDYLNESLLSEGIFDRIKGNPTVRSIEGFLNTSFQKAKLNLNLKKVDTNKTRAHYMIRQRIIEYCQDNLKKMILEQNYCVPDISFLVQKVLMGE